VISVTDTQLNAWLAAYFLPLARVLGLLAAAPLFNNPGMPLRVRLVLGLALTVALVPVLPPLPPVAPGSWQGLALLVQESLVGIAMGFTMRIVFVAIDLAGELIGLQMGLGFALFYDPQNAAQSPVLAEFMGVVALLAFLALNGHLMTLALLAESFHWLPIGQADFGARGWESLVRWGSAIFSAGVLLSLPMIAALLITNIALGVLTRAAPQLNLFAVGFPVTLAAGFVVLVLTMAYLGPVLERLFEQGLDAVSVIFAGAGRAAR
jgi:flagellar biosynthetic protein FliR